MNAPAIIGRRMRYVGTEHPYLRGYDVVIVAVLKATDDGADAPSLRDDNAIARAGGLDARDRVEVGPVLPDGRVSFVTSDARAGDLACFDDLARG